MQHDAKLRSFERCFQESLKIRMVGSRYPLALLLAKEDNLYPDDIFHQRPRTMIRLVRDHYLRHSSLYLCSQISAANNRQDQDEQVRRQLVKVN